MTNMRIRAAFLAAVLLVLSWAHASAAPMSITYSAVDAGESLWAYEFVVEFDNNDGTWAPGQKFDYLTFGNEQSATGQYGAFGDWTWTAIPAIASPNFATGTFNGPTLNFCVTGISCKTSFKDGAWIPQSTGEILFFSGLSSTFIGDTILWSVLKTSGGQLIRFESSAYGASYEANVLPTPLPPALALLLSALAGLGIAGWRRGALEHTDTAS